MRRWMVALVLAQACAGAEDERDAGHVVEDAGIERDAGQQNDAGPVDAGRDTHEEDAGVSAPCDGDGFEALLACLASDESQAGKQARLSAFVAEVDDDAGFPLLEDEEAIFVLVDGQRFDPWPGEINPTAPHVAGDFNAWSSTAHPMTHAGLGVWWARVPMPSPAGVRYKFVDGEKWFADPIGRRFDWDENGRISLVRGDPARARHEWIRRVSSTHVEPRPVYVWLPPGYDTLTTPLPVLVAHDGQNLFDVRTPFAAPASWELDAAGSSEISAGRVAPFVVLGIPNSSARFEEYTHVTDRVGGQTVGGAADDYLAFVVDDVLPKARARWRLTSAASLTVTMGSSLGGLVSMHFAHAKPEVFGAAAALSPTVGWGRMSSANETIIERWGALESLSARGQRVYLDSGGGPPQGGCHDDDGDGIQEGGRDNYCETRQLADLLAAKGLEWNVSLVHWFEPDAPHSEAAWRARLPRLLAFLFPP